MASLTFYGAAATVTGSKTLLEHYVEHPAPPPPGRGSWRGFTAETKAARVERPSALVGKRIRSLTIGA